jgi:hypothetical protein
MTAVDFPNSPSVNDLFTIVTAPITNSGTSTSANIGIDQTGPTTPATPSAAITINQIG